jgi:predicted nuclease with TOPRIM domain
MKKILRYFDINELKKELQEKIKDNKRAIEALKKITFNTKKDGSYFKNLKNNFNNCEIEDDYLKVWYNNYSNSWVVKIFIETDDPAEQAKRTPSHYDFRGKPTRFFKTIPEIKESINEAILKLENLIKEKEALMNNLENEKLIKLLAEASKEYGKLDNSPLHYILFDYFY